MLLADGIYAPVIQWWRNDTYNYVDRLKKQEARVRQNLLNKLYLPCLYV